MGQTQKSRATEKNRPTRGKPRGGSAKSTGFLSARRKVQKKGNEAEQTEEQNYSQIRRRKVRAQKILKRT